MKQKKILFVYRKLDTFVKKDLNVLKDKYEVIPIQITKDINKILEIIKKIRKTDILFIWFAAWHAFLAVSFARIFRKKSIIVVGGYDVAYEPEIGYGYLISWWKRILTRITLRLSDKILPFSTYAEREVMAISRNHNIEMIRLFCETEKFVPNGEKESIVLTVSKIDKVYVKRKGLETFIKSAKRLPDITFVLVGPHLDDSVKYLRDIATPNVKITGFIQEDELIKWYQKAKVYCQLSYQEGEGAGGAVGEAMACECIPVVSEKAVTLKEIVGKYAFYVPYGNVELTVKAIKKALKSGIGKRMRERIKNFSAERRKKELYRIIESEW